MQYLLYILAIPFLYLNYKIIKSDLKEKKIPNKYLLYLLLLVPFFYIVYFFVFGNIDFYTYFFHFFLAFFVSFILYFFGVWAAGDAKYLLILSLFLPNIGIVPIVGNLSLITIVYLLGYFIWFYFFKIPFNKKYANSLFINVKKDLSEKWDTYKKNKGGKNLIIISKWLMFFLVIFVTIRLTRFYLVNSIIGNNYDFIDNLKNIIGKYNYYLFFFGIIVVVGITFVIKNTYLKIEKILTKKYNIEKNKIENVVIIFLTIFLSIFIIYEYSVNPDEISRSLYNIFTLYISLHILIRMLLYSYKITFGIAESYIIKIEELKKGDIVDKMYLLKMFGNQDSLGKEAELLYGGNVAEYFKNLKNPIDEDELDKILKSFEIVNNHHNNAQTNNHQNINQIKILKTFAFGPYIFAGFLITCIYGNGLFVFITNYILDFIKRIVI